MDVSEERQIRIYDLTEEKEKLKLEIAEEQYLNTCLHRKRHMFSASIVKNIIIFLYFLFFYLWIKFIVNITNVWESVKDNPVIQKLLTLSDFAIGAIKAGLLFALAVTVFFLIRKLYLIWLNSDNPSAFELAEQKQLLTYNRQIVASNQKLAALLFHLQEIEDELYALSRQKEI